MLLRHENQGTLRFEKTAPKSTGRDHFNEAWLNKHLQKSYSIQDIQRTLLELTALSISNAIKTHHANISEIYLCGGGALNSFLVAIVDPPSLNFCPYRQLKNVPQLRI